MNKSKKPIIKEIPKLSKSGHSIVRRRLPENRPGLTRRVDACGFTFYLTVNFFDDLQPGEVFIVIAKEGSTVSGFIDALAVTLSIAFQYGTPWKVLVDKYLNQVFEPKDDVNSSLVHAIGMNISEVIELWQKINSDEEKVKLP